MKYNPKTTAIPEIIPVVLICTAGIISAARMHPQLALLLHRDYFRRPDASLSCSFAPQGLFRPAGCISILLFCYTGIISAGRMHLYLALLLHRDYFCRSDASLSCFSVPQGLFCPSWIHLYLPLLLHRDYFCRPDSSPACSFVPQGLFRPAECISSLLFSSTGIISTSRMHLYLPLLLHRDYFCLPDSSPACSFLPQGLFRPARCIPAFLFCPTGIILPRSDASLSSSFASQGLFPSVGFIPAFLFCSTGIISTDRMHLYLPLLLHRDYFRPPNSSLSCSFVPQGLFCPVRMHPYLALFFHRDYFAPVGCISIFLFCFTGIISVGRIHPCLPLLLHRDYFAPAGCISIFLFCSTGIISAARIHPQLALFFHWDYFGQPNASLIRAPVKYQRPNFYYTGNTRMASADTLCKKLPQDRQKQSVLSLSILYFCRYGDILFW